MKLLTAAIKKSLPKLGATDGQGYDAKVRVKFFNPYGVGTWLITEGEEQENGDWLLYGYSELGYEWEWGYVSLNELASLTKFGQPQIERDMYTGLGTVEEMRG